MGIPYLTTLLFPYASHRILSCENPVCLIHKVNDQLDQPQVVIDGPSFAYMVYDKILAYSPEGEGKLPSCYEIGNAALTFLKELQIRGVRIDGIFFDGFLPSTKTATRRSRLENQVQMLSSFHGLRSNDISFLNGRNGKGKDPNKSLTECSTNGSRNLPKVPFLVPAVIEAISESKFAEVTKVVPGEADAYCAEHARRNGSIIITNDSDLLIYELGPAGSVALMNDFEFTFCGRDRAVRTRTIKPTIVAQRLRLPNLYGLAYVLKWHKKPASLQEAVHIAITLEPVKLKAFSEEYTTTPDDFEIDNLHPETRARFHEIEHRTPFLDPRISEIILQCHSISPMIYLPVLIEDPTRTTAWAVSDSLRQFAYSCCFLFQSTGTDKPMVREYGRKAQKTLPTIIPTSVPRLSETELLHYAQTLRSRIHSFQDTFADLPPPCIHRTYALAEVYHWYLNTARTPPSEPAIVIAMTGDLSPINVLTWENVHLDAQIQTALYSLRMIKQILMFVLPKVIVDRQEAQGELVDVLKELRDELRSLPGLRVLMASRGELAKRSKGLDVENLLDRLAWVLRQDVGEDADGDENGDDGEEHDSSEDVDGDENEDGGEEVDSSEDADGDENEGGGVMLQL